MDRAFLRTASSLLAVADDPLGAVAQELLLALGADRLCVLAGAGTSLQPLVEVAAPDPAPTGQRAAGEPACPLCLRLPLPVGPGVWGEVHVSWLRARRPTAGEQAAVRDLVASSAGVMAAAHRLREVRHRADTDSLTGLPNRGFFDDQTERALARHRADGTELAVVMCDVNGLKQVNDRRGHDAGDRHLVEVAALVRRAAQRVPGAVGARLGGDEFGLLLPGVSTKTALEVAEQLCGDVCDLELGAGLSCGIATTGAVLEPVDSVRQLLRLADAAQYRAKRAGLTLPVLVGQRQGQPPGPGERRRSPLHREPALALLEQGLAALDGSTGQAPAPRLRAVAQVCVEQLDTAGWWVSHVPAGSRLLRSVDCSDIRAPVLTHEREEQAALGTPFDLDQFPASAAAVRGGSLGVELGAPDNDPAEEHVLAVSGFTGLVAAGATDAAGDGWLLEVFFDLLSAAHAGIAPVLRALVLAAVRG